MQFIVFYDNKCLKIGKVGKKSKDRYTNHHYSTTAANSTLAGSICKSNTTMFKYTESDIRRMLNENSKTFVEWRYFLSGTDIKVNVQFLMALMNSTHEVVRSLHNNSK